MRAFLLDYFWFILIKWNFRSVCVNQTAEQNFSIKKTQPVQAVIDKLHVYISKILNAIF